jgi:predicted transcriptional regulator
LTDRQAVIARYTAFTIMKTAKQEVLETLDQLPDDVALEKVVYELHIKAKIRRGLEQLERGETVPHDEVMEDLERWLRSIGQ